MMETIIQMENKKEQMKMKKGTVSKYKEFELYSDSGSVDVKVDVKVDIDIINELKNEINELKNEINELKKMKYKIE